MSKNNTNEDTGAHTHAHASVCEECGGENSFHFDPFGFGNLVDQHMDTELPEDELSKRLTDAMEMARRLGGKVPGGIEDELEELTRPKLTWQDFIRGVKARKKASANKNDWNSPKRKPLFSGLYVPKKNEYIVKFLLAIDTSASMNNKDIAFGISQIQVLNEKGEGYIVSWDTQVYWDKIVKVKSAKPEELKKTNIVGRGGTCIADLFETYQKKVGSVDIMVIITDGGLYDLQALNNVNVSKDTQVIWLVVNNMNFAPPFGRVFKLENN